MNRTTTIMIVILLLCAITTQGTPISGSQGRCQCPQTTPINPRHIKSLNYIPKGSHCETLEIIVTMKNGNRLCVSPDAGWVKIIIKATKGARPQN
ncbi:interleukin-8-like isoform X2 [Cetorhinus maximus]